VWDTAGEERFRSLASMYYKDAEAILVGFSLGDYQSFENMNTWLEEVEDNITIHNSVKVIVGLKCDLPEQ